jgi:hypothetical protein
VTCGEHPPIASVTGTDVNTIFVSTLKLLLVAPVRPLLLAENVYAPALSTLRLENVAEPPTAAMLVVPVKFPPAGLRASATVAPLLVGFPN